jgi:hypothetical protein
MGVDVNVVQSGVTVPVATAVTAEGFSFSIPEAAVVKPDGTGSFSVNAVMADGSPLPSWITFNPETRTFSAKEIPNGVDSLTISVQTIDGSKVVGATTLEIKPKVKAAQ